ncbi:MAG TPA: hypothetical protein VFY29_01410 [Terriglobia bacterium]|nr:hypothetical protein [Terriglobia bacterium]
MSAVDLRAALSEVFGRPVSDVSRTVSIRSSSCAIEDLIVRFGNGETREVVFKNLGPDGKLEAARAIRPSFVYTQIREIEVYRALLSRFNLGAPRLYGAKTDSELDRYWLFLEKISAPALFEIAAFERWLDAAAWLGLLHGACDAEEARRAAPSLATHDAEYYWRWLRRARKYAGPALDRIASGYHHVVDALLRIPHAWIHGEFYPSNILVGALDNPRICAVDWELSAVAPALLDVAALASGSWTRAQRLQMLNAYLEKSPPHLRRQDAVHAFDCCQLHIAIQWLGWSENWRPHRRHAHDWLSEAIALAALPSLAGFFKRP